MIGATPHAHKQLGPGPSTRTVIHEEHLVDDDVVCVDVELQQLLDEALRLVEGQKLGDAHAHEGRLVRVAQARLHLVDLACSSQRQRQLGQHAV